MRFHLLRHAQTEANAKGLLAYEIEEPLNSVGLHQADLLVEYLRRIEFDEILCSSLIRARQTIEPYLKSNPKIIVKYEPLLCEGQFNLDSSAPTRNPEFSPETGLPIEPETLGAFRGRVVAMLSQLQGYGEDSTILCVTHGHFIRELLNNLLSEKNYRDFATDNCSDTLVELGEHTVIHYVNRLTL